MPSRGRADDLLTATLLTARCPVLFAPAMHTEMWLHPATVDNVATLRRRGAVVLEPASGRLTGADSGAGRLPEAEEITTLAQLLLERARRAALRPGRRQGAGHRRRHPRADRPGALHRQPQLGQAGLRGGPRGRPARRRCHADRRATPRGSSTRPASTSCTSARRHQLHDAVSKHAPDAHVLVMAAAVADFRPAHVATSKIKKGARRSRPTIELTRTDDVLAGAVRARTDGQLPNMRAIVGFAAETGDANGDVLFHARAKLAPQGVRPAGRQRGRRGPGVRGGQQRRLAAGLRRHRGRAGARFEDV